MRIPWLLTLAALAGCVDTTHCHMATDWKPCAGEVAQPGASGTPPGIVELSLPTCAYLDDPTLSGTLHVTDPDGDAQTVKAAFYAGMRLDEVDVTLPDSGRSGTEWTGTVVLSTVANGGTAPMMQETDDVIIKVTDRAGGQSVPFCGSFSLVQ